MWQIEMQIRRLGDGAASIGDVVILLLSRHVSLAHDLDPERVEYLWDVSSGIEILHRLDPPSHLAMLIRGSRVEQSGVRLALLGPENLDDAPALVLAAGDGLHHALCGLCRADRLLQDLAVGSVPLVVPQRCVHRRGADARDLDALQPVCGSEGLCEAYQSGLGGGVQWDGVAARQSRGAADEQHHALLVLPEQRPHGNPCELGAMRDVYVDLGVAARLIFIVVPEVGPVRLEEPCSAYVYIRDGAEVFLGFFHESVELGPVSHVCLEECDDCGFLASIGVIDEVLGFGEEARVCDEDLGALGVSEADESKVDACSTALVSF